MEATPKQVVFYETQDGRIPFDVWVKSIRDIRKKPVITTKNIHGKLGKLANYRSLGNGVCELRIDYRFGYQIYFNQVENTIISY